MELEHIIYKNIGKDIYFCIENCDGRREESIFKGYTLTRRNSLNRIIVLRASRSLIPEMEVYLDARILSVKERLLKTNIEAEYDQTFYHIYISDHINTEANREFRKRINGLTCRGG